MENIRLDAVMYERGMCKSRERARQLIKNGMVTVNGKVCTKPAYSVSDETKIEVTGDIHRYVGRGGLKLEKAISEFKIILDGAVCLDIGASTGGFTDCMLQSGAARVYALDVGHSQLDESLACDPRVINIENTNIRNSSKDDFPDIIDFIATDVSFISLKLVLPKIKEILAESGQAAVLLKPQFEAGRSNIGKSGIVSDPRVHKNIISDMLAFCDAQGLCVCGFCVSPVKGGSGNSEYLMHLKHKNDNSINGIFDTDSLVKQALGKDR